MKAVILAGGFGTRISEETIIRPKPMIEIMCIYKYIHILRIPVMANHAIIYGNAIHETIQFYYKRKMDKKSVLLGELIDKFKAHWESVGFLSIEHEEQRLEEGRETLRKFFYRSENEDTIPKYIEKRFKIKYGGDIIIGRFDRVDYDGKNTVIIDFKTSEVSNKKDAEYLKSTKGHQEIAAAIFRALKGYKVYYEKVMETEL